MEICFEQPGKILGNETSYMDCFKKKLNCDFCDIFSELSAVIAQKYYFTDPQKLPVFNSRSLLTVRPPCGGT